ncbi:MAG TPA: acyltransferase domain-containing protein [Geobacteraceae bacterium]|nr:acyltransferase domain-containing protein [Geobacteraceae bacterium]
MICFMFPGQPLSFITSLPDDPDFTAVARIAEERTYLDLDTLAWTKGELTENVKLQVYGAAMSLYRNRLLLREGNSPDIIAEHSMGIYSALAVCGAITEADALELVYRIGVSLAGMGKGKAYSLGCVIGLTLEPLSAIAGNNGVFLANFNTSRHFLLSGTASAMEEAMSEALAGGAFSAKAFPCDAPLHSPLMEELLPSLDEICGEYCYREPEIPILEHIGQKRLSAAEMASFMARELCLPVYWEKTYLALKASGVGRFVEVGSGDSLKKYNRWIDNEYRPG